MTPVRPVPALSRPRFALLAFIGCLVSSNLHSAPPIPAGTPLRDLASTSGLIFGAAIKDGFSASAMGSADYAAFSAVAKREFQLFTPENAMKWGQLKSSATAAYDWAKADPYVSFAAANNGRLHGHALVWFKPGNGVPVYVRNIGDRATLLNTMESHIASVAPRWGDQVWAWDVVNEAITDYYPNGQRSSWNDALRTTEPTADGYDHWRKVIGDDYIRRAFDKANAVRQAANHNYDLLYNDYNTDGIERPHKAHAQRMLIDYFVANGVPIDGIGYQMHLTQCQTSDPTNAQYDAFRTQLQHTSSAGLDIYITELDVLANPNSTSTVDYNRQARIYNRVVDLALRNPHLRGLQIWGVTDRYTETSKKPHDPLLFNDPSPFSNYDYAPKPAYYAVQDALHYQARGQLAANPGFESDLAGWSARGAGVTLQVISTGAQSGAKAVRVANRVNDWDGVGQDIRSALLANSAGAGRYLISGWVRRATGEGRAKITVRLRDSDNTITYHSASATVGTAWTRLEQEVNLAWRRGLQEAVLYVETVGYQGQFDADDIRLGDGNLIANAGFESGSAAWGTNSVCTLSPVPQSESLHGSGALRVEGRTAAYAGPSQNVLPALLAHGPGSYELRGYARSATDGLVVKATLRLKINGVDTYLNVNAPVSADDNAWTRIAGTLNLGWSTPPTEAQLYLETGAGSTATFTIDELLLRRNI